MDLCVCGSTKSERQVIHKLNMAVCLDCGIKRQIVNLSEKEIADFYKNQYHQEEYTHTFEQDVKVAKMRIQQYGIEAKTRLLDVGCGNGAFVMVSRMNGINALGVELSCDEKAHSKHVHYQDLLEVNFPTEYFDAITLNDVLEHFPDPRPYLEECFRILKPNGRLIIDFPDFEFKHHWKEVEHLWMLEPEQLTTLVSGYGFKIQKTTRPVKSKRTFFFQRPKIQRASIMVPPGIGDIYWVLTKLKSFCKDKGIGIPDLLISSPRPDRDRSFPYVQKVPFINAAGYVKHKNHQDPIWREAYLEDGRTVFPKHLGCDYFMAYNGVTRFGAALEDVDPQWEVDWHFPIYEDLEEKQARIQYKAKYGKYFVVYVVPHGMYAHWKAEFNLHKTREAIELIQKQTGARPILVGASWDETYVPNLLGMKTNSAMVDLTGKTTLSQAFALMKESIGVFGYPSGLSIMATVFKIPTLLLWNEYFVEDFWKNSCPKGSLDNWYKYLDTKYLQPKTVANTFKELVK